MNSKKVIRISLFSALAITLVMTTVALPSEARRGGGAGGGGHFAQNHPRRAEVLGRDRNIQNRINQDRGDLHGHYGQLSQQDRSIRRQEQRDARQNGGYLTKGEQQHFNGEENRLNRQIARDNSGAGGAGFQQRHPRRSEVLGRDAGLNNQINNDRGKLGGNYGHLQREDRGIQRQEQRDASINGGYITKGQQNQINREENRLQQQVHHDYTGGNVNPGGPNQPGQ